MNYALSFWLGRAFADAEDIKLKLPGTIKYGLGDFGTLWNNIFDLVFAFLAVAAFASIIYSGVTMITSGGDATKFAVGKKNLIWSIIGIIIVIMAFFTISFVISLTKTLTTP